MMRSADIWGNLWRKKKLMLKTGMIYCTKKQKKGTQGNKEKENVNKNGKEKGIWSVNSKGKWGWMGAS